jgi:hypothetical protein
VVVGIGMGAGAGGEVVGALAPGTVHKVEDDTLGNAIPYLSRRLLRGMRLGIQNAPADVV